SSARQPLFFAHSKHPERSRCRRRSRNWRKPANRDLDDADGPAPSAQLPRTSLPLKGEQSMNTNTATEYRNLPLAVLTESATNPRRIFEDSALKELAESIRSQGVLFP